MIVQSLPEKPSPLPPWDMSFPGVFFCANLSWRKNLEFHPILEYDYKAMYFKIIGKIEHIEIIARGSSIRDLKRLEKKYGPGRWRKLKGQAYVELIDGEIRIAEIHWYEAHGIGKKRFKIKHFLD